MAFRYYYQQGTNPTLSGQIDEVNSKIATVEQSINNITVNYVPKNNPIVNANLIMSNNRITQLANGINGNDAITKSQLDEKRSLFVSNSTINNTNGLYDDSLITLPFYTLYKKQALLLKPIERTPQTYTGTLYTINDFSTFQNTISLLNNGDRIDITSNITLTSTLTIDKSIRLYSSNNSILSSSQTTTLVFSGDNVLIENITINNSSTSSVASTINFTSTTANNNIVRNATIQTNEFAIQSTNNQIQIVDCRFELIGTPDSQRFINLQKTTGTTIIHNCDFIGYTSTQCVFSNSGDFTNGIISMCDNKTSAFVTGFNAVQRLAMFENTFTSNSNLRIICLNNKINCSSGFIIFYSSSSLQGIKDIYLENNQEILGGTATGSKGLVGLDQLSTNGTINSNCQIYEFNNIVPNLRIDYSDITVEQNRTVAMATGKFTLSNNFTTSNKWVNIGSLPNYDSEILQINSNITGLNSNITNINSNLTTLNNNLISNVSLINSNITNINNALPLKANLSGANFTGDVSISGNLTASGQNTLVNATSLEIQDSMAKIARNNTSTDLVDIGQYGVYNSGGVVKYTGIFRDASDGIYKFYNGLQEEPTTTVNVSGAGFTNSDIQIKNVILNNDNNDNKLITSSGALTLQQQGVSEANDLSSIYLANNNHGIMRTFDNPTIGSGYHTRVYTSGSSGRVSLSASTSPFDFIDQLTVGTGNISSKVPLDMNSQKITNVANGTNSNDAVNLSQISQISGNIDNKVSKSGDTMTGELLINNRLLATSIITQEIQSTVPSMILRLSNNNKIQLTNNLNTLYGDISIGGNIYSIDGSINFYNANNNEIIGFLDDNQLYLSGSRITSMGEPSFSNDGATKGYVDTNFYNKTYINTNYPIGILDNITLPEDGVIPNFNSTIGKIVITTLSTSSILTRLNYGNNTIPNNHRCDIYNNTNEKIYLNYLKVGGRSNNGHILASVYSYISSRGFITLIFDSSSNLFRIPNDRVDNFENKLYLYPLYNNFNSAYLHLSPDSGINIKFAIQFRGNNEDDQTINGVIFSGTASTSNPLNLKIRYASNIDINYTGSLAYYNYGAQLDDTVLTDQTLRDNFTGMLYNATTWTFTMKGLQMGKYYTLVFPYFVWGSVDDRRAFFGVLDANDTVELPNKEVSHQVFSRTKYINADGFISVYCWRQETTGNKKFRITNRAGWHIYSVWCYDLGYNPL